MTIARRVDLAIQNRGQTIQIDGVDTVAICRPLSASQLQTFLSPSEFSSWIRPIWMAVISASQEVENDAEVVTDDWVGRVHSSVVRWFNDARLCRFLLIEQLPDPLPPPDPLP